jgi:hypothetical protein
MNTKEVGPVLARLFGELVDGASSPKGAVILNTGDVGLLRSIEALDAFQASQAVNGGATIAAHAQHLRYGLSLMNRWATEGGDPFSDATWDAAWKITTVDDGAWAEIRAGLRDEAHRFHLALVTPREATAVELAGLAGTVAHLAYHLGAIRQIDKHTRGPREGTF